MDAYEAVKLTENSPGDYAHYKSHMDWPGIEPGPLQWESTPLLNCKNRFFKRKKKKKKKKKKREEQKKNKKNKYARVTPRSVCKDLARIRFRNTGKVISII